MLDKRDAGSSNEQWNTIASVLIHYKATKHRRVVMKNVKILGRRYKSDFKRRISESLFIKKIKPDLNKDALIMGRKRNIFSNFDFDLITLRIEPFRNFEKKFFLVEKFSVEKFSKSGAMAS